MLDTWTPKPKVKIAPAVLEALPDPPAAALPAPLRIWAYELSLQGIVRYLMLFHVLSRLVLVKAFEII